jgi:hypothetical protein
MLAGVIEWKGVQSGRGSRREAEREEEGEVKAKAGTAPKPEARSQGQRWMVIARDTQRRAGPRNRVKTYSLKLTVKHPLGLWPMAYNICNTPQNMRLNPPCIPHILHLIRNNLIRTLRMRLVLHFSWPEMEIREHRQD